VINNHVVIEDPRIGYVQLLKDLRDHGEAANPRGVKTYEMFDVVMKLDPRYVLVTGINRGISLKLISMEGLQLIAGVTYPNRTILAAPNMANFTDGEVFHGAYGPRIAPQLPHVVERLRKDPDSRQALMTVFNPLYDLGGDPPPRDIPCTALIQFFIRKNRLVMHVTMRSNDVWWGTPHDWGQFSQLQMGVANTLDIEPGDYYHHAVSFHLYERDTEKIDTLTEPSGDPFMLDGIGYRGIPLSILKCRALSILNESSVEPLQSFSEQWHIEQQRKITGSANDA